MTEANPAVGLDAGVEDGAPPYRVEVEHGDLGWEVRIVGEGGGLASVRPCGSETEARTYASTVIQHLGWLSAAKFREYYRL